MGELNLIGTQPFDTKRCRLRPFKLSDAQYIYKNWASSENVAKYCTWNAHKSVEESTAYCIAMMKDSRNLDRFHWIIELTETGEPIGDIFARRKPEEPNKAHIGYVIGEEHWNKGIMTEAVEAVLAYLIFVIGFDSVIGEHFPENIASGKVMQKLGMKKTGTSKLVLDQKGGEEVITEVYEITKPEWFAKNIRV